MPDLSPLRSSLDLCYQNKIMNLLFSVTQVVSWYSSNGWLIHKDHLSNWVNEEPFRTELEFSYYFISISSILTHMHTHTDTHTYTYIYMYRHTYAQIHRHAHIHTEHTYITPH